MLFDFAVAFQKQGVVGSGADITLLERFCVFNRVLHSEPLSAVRVQTFCLHRGRRYPHLTPPLLPLWLMVGELESRSQVARNVEKQPKISVKVPHHQRNGLCQGQTAPEVKNVSNIDFEMVNGNVRLKTTRSGRQGCFYESIQRIKTMRINQNEKEEKNPMVACCR